MATEFSTSDPTLVPNNGAEPEEDEEHWLYGDETKKQSGENVAGFPDANQESYLSNTNEKQAAEKAAKSGEDDDNDESDSDDDDDVKVTIGNIKTGAPSYMAPPMNLSLKSGRSYGVTAPAKLQSKGIDMEAVGSINGLPVVEVDIDIFEDKPWRKPGADLSDYFNYGFNEETWKAYCEKQRRLQLGLEPGAPLNSENKITVQQGRSAVLEKEIESAAIKSEFKMDFLPPANILPAANRLKAGPPPNRKLGGTIDVIGGQTGAIRRVEGRRREIHEHNPIQVLGDHAGKTPPFAPPAGLPPPPIGAPPPHFLHPPPPVSGMPPPLHPPGIPPPAIPGGAPPLGTTPELLPPSGTTPEIPPSSATLLSLPHTLHGSRLWRRAAGAHRPGSTRVLDGTRRESGSARGTGLPPPASTAMRMSVTTTTATRGNTSGSFTTAVSAVVSEAASETRGTGTGAIVTRRRAANTSRPSASSTTERRVTDIAGTNTRRASAARRRKRCQRRPSATGRSRRARSSGSTLFSPGTLNIPASRRPVKLPESSARGTSSRHPVLCFLSANCDSAVSYVICQCITHFLFKMFLKTSRLLTLLLYRRGKSFFFFFVICAVNICIWCSFR